MIYLDNHATTQVHPEVVEAMLPFLHDHFHNPSSGYRASRIVRKAIAKARGQVSELIGAKEEEIVFTGCGTESNNMVLKSLARIYGRKSSRVITGEIEHSAVLRPCEAMEAVGFDLVRWGSAQCRRRKASTAREKRTPSRARCGSSSSLP